MQKGNKLEEEKIKYNISIYEFYGYFPQYKLDTFLLNQINETHFFNTISR